MKTQKILGILKVVASLTFMGFCFQTGIMFLLFLIGLLELTNLSNMDVAEAEVYEKWYTSIFFFLVIIQSGLKAYLFYLVMKVLFRIKITHPFSETIGHFILKMSMIALQIGIIGLILDIYAEWLVKTVENFTDIGGGTEYLFFAGILFVIAQIYKRGIELQSENELIV